MVQKSLEDKTKEEFNKVLTKEEEAAFFEEAMKIVDKNKTFFLQTKVQIQLKQDCHRLLTNEELVNLFKELEDIEEKDKELFTQTKIQDKLKKEFQKVFTEDEEMKEAGEAFIMQRLIENATEEVERLEGKSDNSKIRGEVISSKEYPAEITKAEENTPFLEEMSKKEKEKKTLFAEMHLQYEHESCEVLSKDEAMRYIEDMRKKEGRSKYASRVKKICNI